MVRCAILVDGCDLLLTCSFTAPATPLPPFFLCVELKVRLGYPRAPRKKGANQFDPSRGIGRDRMVKDNTRSAEDERRLQMERAQQKKQPMVQFTNKDIPGVKLYFASDTEVFMGDLGIGQSLNFNTFEGHRWVVRGEGGGEVIRVAIDNRPQQYVELSMPRGADARTRRTPRPPGARPPG